MDEVNIQSIDIQQEMIEAIDFCLRLRPIEAVPPVVDELAQIMQFGAIRPCVVIDLIGPSRSVDALVQISDRIVLERYSGKCVAYS